jgi:SSS family solute:Na+ symporter
VSSGALTVGLALALYVALVLALGLAATRRSSRSPEEYFLAGRRLGPLVLFMALFGTNATAFVLVGIPGLAYRQGVGVFGLNAAILALGIPLSSWAIGAPARRLAQELGALTPAELYARRLGSRSVGALLFAFFTLYTLPYMVTAVDGAAVTLEKSTGLDGRVGGITVLAVALLYTSLGGMRATAWTNVLQGSVFLVFMVAVLLVLPGRLGGLAAATEATRAVRPELLVKGDTGLFAPAAWGSWGLGISFCVIAFPHMLVRFFTARSEASLRTITCFYPLALILLWLPAVLIGLWGAGQFPGLEGKEADAIFGLMTTRHLPPWLGLCGFLAVLAAVMSTLDAQLLTLSSMLVRDVLHPRHTWDRAHREVWIGRGFAVGLAALVWVLAQVWSASSVFDVSRKAFEGYTTLVPALFLGVRWRRFTATGAVASIVAGNLVLVGGWRGELPTAGFLPVWWAFLAASLAGIAASRTTPAQDEKVLEVAFGPRERALPSPARAPDG